MKKNRTKAPTEINPTASAARAQGLRLNRQRAAGWAADLWTNLFRAMAYRNYRVFFLGQSVSLIGTWMQQIAMSWLVYRLTGSAFMLGLVGFATQIPAFGISPFAGVFIDRSPRRRLLILTQSLAMLQALALAVLTLAGAIEVWHILSLGVFLGVVNAFDMPGRQAFVLDLVENKSVLGNAIALNSTIFNIARLIGPAVGGILIALVGEGTCFLLNAVSFLAVIFSLFSLRLPQSRRPQTARLGTALKEGFVYVFGFAPIRAVLILLSVVSLVGMSYIILMPIFAKQILHGGPDTMGFLMAAIGLGALLGTLLLASRPRGVSLGRVLPLSVVVFAIGLSAFAYSRSLWLSLPFLVLTGFGFIVNMTSSNTILQTLADDDKRGRVMSFYTMSFIGMAPVGSLVAGALAQRIGAPAVLLLGAALCLSAAILFSRRLPALQAEAQPVYQRLAELAKAAVPPAEAS